MRILSNFDTSLKSRTLKRYQSQYGEDNVILLVKSRLFGVVKFYIPIILVFLVEAGLSYVICRVLSLSVFWFVLFLVCCILFTFFQFSKKLIEYRMDFSIVTPMLLITYDQQWFFRRQIKTINVQNIKTISVERNGFLYSLFNNGDLIFLSEGDMDNGEVFLHYLHKPEKRRHEIAQILGRV